MDKRDFVDFLDFPSELLEFNLYSDELLKAQKNEMLSDLSDKELEEKILSKKYGEGSEHYRYGAFLWIMKNIEMTDIQKFKIAIAKEDDIILKKCMIKDINEYEFKKDMKIKYL